MSLKFTCNLKNDPASYDIEIKSGLLTNIEFYAKSWMNIASKFVIITDSNLNASYGQHLYNSLSPFFSEGHLLTFPAGEKNKTRESKLILEDQMLKLGIGQDTCLFALGGGVATDLAGYVAATYCRGIPLIMIPTSLLGMVDAALGGKNGVNTPQGKNLIGTIHHPKNVLIDPYTLHTLSTQEIRNGVVEMIKHGLIIDQNYFDFLETHSQSLLGLDPATIEQAIYASCRIKTQIIEYDEKNTGKRHLLNFGHTIGHAIENISNYSVSHGEAVAIGLLVESHLAVQMEQLSPQAFTRILHILKSYSLPLKIPKECSIVKMLELMSLDKKTLKGIPRFVILNKIGSALPFDGKYCTHVDEDLLENSLKWMLNDLHSH